ncbi:hypothetical protein [Methanosarcina mazei]|uniref:Uncharacterized protein n=1 Tax=Methanosarcina mazei TaxID=2209 RepID=A0A0F8IFD6_METMZ|nr:hypothetical protein [Methanosarcina mazei]KKG67194.1 hypothetical protein DU43_20060 [Methanosarcina mazei]KKG86374.1 hypothetical protein DU57_16295 [Methanosarcina mazei]KKG87731.1 hypothetical protein DU69_07550 [Methanosarcina mazei]KKG88447.1 hypothetical protein DU59_03615 [Methanosarcina mazei]KKH10232.1 hypothetical protein DU42_11885 [Methanosarcina mazei]
MQNTSDILIFWAVVMSRFFIPFFIPKYPLPGVIASLLLDAVDQTIFQTFTGLPLEGYQAYDKALDVYYLAITYLSTLRNWSNDFAFRLSRFLFYYRLAGVAIFELTELREMLLIFPNAFEYFFIFYEAVRMKWNPELLTREKLLISTVLIWVFVKLPQEYWIHIAKMDTTDWIGENPLNSLFLVGWAAVLTGMAWWLLRDLPSMKPGFSITAHHAEFKFDSPLASHIKDNYTSERFFDDFIHHELIEKIVLISLLSIIFAQILPVRANNVQIAIGVSLLIAINTELSQWLARRGTQWKSIIQEFIVMSIVNFSLVLLFDFLLARYQGSINLLNTLFFVLLLTLNITLYDRYRRVYIWNHDPVTDFIGSEKPVELKTE